MAKKKKNPELTEEQKAFNKKMGDFQSRALCLSREIYDFLCYSELWPTVPEKNREMWLDNTCIPFATIQRIFGRKCDNFAQSDEAWKWT